MTLEHTIKNLGKITKQVRENYEEKMVEEIYKEFGDFIRGLKKLSEPELKQLNKLFKDIELSSRESERKDLLEWSKNRVKEVRKNRAGLTYLSYFLLELESEMKQRKKIFEDHNKG